MRIFKYLKKFILFIIKETFSALILIGVLIVILVTISLSLGKKIENKPYIPNNTYIVLSLPNGIKENNDINLNLFSQEKNLTFYELIRTINYAKDDDKISGFVLNLDYLNLSFSQIEELTKELNKFKQTGKKIFAYGESINKNSYLLGSISDKIYMNPSASTDLILDGFKVSVPYYKNLANNFGVEFQIIHIGNFKTYGENFVKDSISDEFKYQYESLLQNRLDYFVEQISNNRQLKIDKFKDDFINGKFIFLNSKKAKENFLIDKQLSYDEFLKSNKIEKKITLSEYYSSKSDYNFENKIALINLEGDISNSSNMPNSITPENLFPLLDRARDDSSVKGIVLRINSPGGSALASEIINQKIKEIKKSKPVYVSISEMAASGGYYISVASNKIFANVNSVTGSIGVVSMFFNLDELYKKLGLKYESIELGKVPYSFDINKKIPTDEIDLLRGNMTDIYDEFKSRVSQGRKLNLDKVEELAQGKVYSGLKAKELGLIDEIGSLSETIDRLGSDLQLGDYEIVVYEKDFNKFKEYLNFSNYIKQSNLFEKFDKVQENLKVLKELNGKPSLLFPIKSLDK